MKKLFVAVCAFIVALPLVMTACGGQDDDPAPDDTVTIRITDDGGCFQRFTFTVDKGTVLDASMYENIMRINNGGKKVYFLGGWVTADGEDFDFSEPVIEDVTISPQKTQVYFEEDNYPNIVMSANEELRGESDMKTVVLPIKSPDSGNSMTNATLVGGGKEDCIFDSFSQIETAVIPEEIHNVSGALFLNCTGLKEVYFPGYGYYMNQTVTPNFLLGCTALEQIYFTDEEAVDDFRKMLADAISDAAEEGEDTSNLKRLEDLCAVKEAPYMYWDADSMYMSWKPASMGE